MCAFLTKALLLGKKGKSKMILACAGAIYKSRTVATETWLIIFSTFPILIKSFRLINLTHKIARGAVT